MTARVLVAGIGNVFLGDDGFGVAVVQRLLERGAPAGVRVLDAGIRGFDLACALLEGWNAAILIDAVRRGGPPGTLYVLEIEAETTAPAGPIEAHGLVPHRALALVRALGGTPPPLRLVGCEPARVGPDDDIAPGLSAPVAAAVDGAVELVQSLARELSATAMSRA
jgi:hydrogenase maturation protease